MTEPQSGLSGRHLSDRYPLLLLGAFAVLAVALGVSPWYRQDWLLENLLVVAALCVFVPTFRHRRFSNVLPVTFILSHSAIYELIEWAAALVFGGELGTAYLGTQGDEWDSQKDMACAASGALLAMTIMGMTGFLRGATSVVRPPVRS